MGKGFRGSMISFNDLKLSAFDMSRKAWTPILGKDPDIPNIVFILDREARAQCAGISKRVVREEKCDHHEHPLNSTDSIDPVSSSFT